MFYLDKYKPALLFGDGSRVPVSILVVLPQKIQDSNHKKSRAADLAYYLSKDKADVENYDDKKKDQENKSQMQSLNSAAVSHACCALVM